MGEAKVEAEKTVSNFRQDLDNKYQAAHATIQNNAGSAGSELNTKTTQEISAMGKDFVSQKAAIEDSLVAAVCSVDNSAAGKMLQ